MKHASSVQLSDTHTRTHAQRYARTQIRTHKHSSVHAPALVSFGPCPDCIVTEHALDDVCEKRRAHLALSLALWLLRPARRHADLVPLKLKPLAGTWKLNSICVEGQRSHEASHMHADQQAMTEPSLQLSPKQKSPVQSRSEEYCQVHMV